ncbi:MAG: hypothetical protein ACRCSP_04525 [Rhodoglobus sp.]
MSHNDHSEKMKQHAQRRDVHRRHPLWVYNEDDWRLMRSGLPTGDLICPEEGCRAELVAAQLQKSGTRFLRNRPGTPDCGHAFGRGRGGGPMSAEHRWFQQRLAQLCGDLGYEAIQEHYDSQADVWVKASPPLAIEVQRWPTAFSHRSSVRQAKGANIVWFLPESASSKKAGDQLFGQPAARLRVFKRGNHTEEARPWEAGHSGRVVLMVGATVMRPTIEGLSLESAGNYDARDFLDEVLKGKRQWYGPNEPGFKYGAGWARPDDVEQMRAKRSAHRHADIVGSTAVPALRPLVKANTDDKGATSDEAKSNDCVNTVETISSTASVDRATATNTAQGAKNMPKRVAIFDNESLLRDIEASEEIRARAEESLRSNGWIHNDDAYSQMAASLLVSFLRDQAQTDLSPLILRAHFFIDREKPFMPEPACLWDDPAKTVIDRPKPESVWVDPSRIFPNRDFKDKGDWTRNFDQKESEVRRKPVLGLAEFARRIAKERGDADGLTELLGPGDHHEYIDLDGWDTPLGAVFQVSGNGNHRAAAFAALGVPCVLATVRWNQSPFSASPSTDSNTDKVHCAYRTLLHSYGIACYPDPQNPLKNFDNIITDWPILIDSPESATRSLIAMEQLAGRRQDKPIGRLPRELFNDAKALLAAGKRTIKNLDRNRRLIEIGRAVALTRSLIHTHTFGALVRRSKSGN